MMSEGRSVRDPVHGFIRLKAKEDDIVATPVFQRLRGIRQLAFASLVYPGAVHTRFGHTLGVFHVASLMAESKPFGLEEEERQLIRYAALLHDLGHGPFSHVSEGLLEIFADKSKVSGRLKGDNAAKIHELVTSDLLATDPDLRHVLGGSEIEKVQRLLAHGYGDPILRSIVSGPLDADKQDYLLRDSYFCGVKYGIFDLHQFHRELVVLVDPTDGSKGIAITEDGVHTLEQFVLAKYYLTTQVYRHRVRRITDEMIVRAITLGIEVDNLEELRELYAYDGSERFLHNYVAWDDARFLLTFGDQRFEGKRCHELVTGLRKRKLLKEVFEENVSVLPERCRPYLDGVVRADNRCFRKALERDLAAAIQDAGVRLQCDGPDPAELVIANAYSFRSVREQSRDDEGPIMVNGSREPRAFEDVSSLFKSINDKLVEQRFAVFAPVTWENAREKRSTKDKLRQPIHDCLERFKWQAN